MLPVEPVVPEGVAVVPVGVLVVPCEVEVVPCDVEVVPGAVDVAAGAVLCPMPALGVTEPVLCAVAMPMESANTDEANRIFFINLLLLNGVCEFNAVTLEGKILRLKSS